MRKFFKVTIGTLFAVLFFLIVKDCNKDSFDSYIGFDIPKASMDEFLDSKMKQYNIPGLSMAFINEGKIVYKTTKGVTNKHTQSQVDANTIFEGASISKPVFGFFVMTLVEDGILELDKPLYQYMEYSDIADDERYKKITARMVMSHRSGFPNWREDSEDNKLRITFDPGTNYEYSGEGYQFLTKVLMHILQLDHAGLEEEFQKRVAQPIGLKHTVFIQNDYTRQHKAEPYDEDGKWIDWKNNYWFQKEDGKFYSPSSIHSEPLDFSKWMIAVMNEEILSKESYEELFKHHSKVPFEGLDVSYTLGFAKPNIPFTDIYLHGGNNIGFTSYFVLDRQKDWGFVLFTNSEFGEQLGMDTFFFTAADPGRTKLYFSLGIVFIFTILMFVALYKWARRKLRKN